jgi:uncharacterized protein YndB with AHSA1/START domain
VQEVERGVVLPAEVGAVWAEVAGLVPWLATEADLVIEAGRRGRLTLHEGGTVRALVEAVEPGERFVIRWWSGGPGGRSTRVEVRLRAIPEGGTEVTVNERADLMVGTAVR